MPPIQLYYEGSPEEDQDLLELRQAHYDRLHALRLQAARYGDAVPANIAAGIADAESQINAIDEVRRAKIRPETAERMGATGQFTILAGRLDLLSQQVQLSQKQADDWRDAQARVQQRADEWRDQFRSSLDALADIQRDYEKRVDEWRQDLGSGLKALADTQRTFQRTTRMIFQAIGAILVIVALAMMGLAAALWTLK